MKGLICAILVNYNGASDTYECVESLMACTYKNLRIIIVDNDSKDGKVEYCDCIPADKCEILYLNENIGFAGANNYGMEYAQKYAPDFYLILNNDTIVKKDFLEPLVQACEEDPTVGIATGKILYYDEPDVISFGGSYFDSKLCEYKFEQSGVTHDPKEREHREIPFASGCLWLLTKEARENVGPMSEDYFLYYEDTDYCERLCRKNYKIMYVPESVIYHKESRSTKKGSRLYYYYNTRNYLMFMKKFFPLSKRYKAVIRRMIRSIKDCIRGRRNVQQEWETWVDYIKGKKGKLQLPQ